MVYLPIAGGGEVFSVGSIGFVGAMAWNDFNNSTARLLDNVLAEFVAGTNAGRIKVETEPSSEGSGKVAPRHADPE